MVEPLAGAEHHGRHHILGGGGGGGRWIGVEGWVTVAQCLPMQHVEKKLGWSGARANAGGVVRHRHGWLTPHGALEGPRACQCSPI